MLHAEDYVWVAPLPLYALWNGETVVVEEECTPTVL